MLITWRIKFKMDDHVYLNEPKGKINRKKKKVIHRRKWLPLEEKLKIIDFHDSGKRIIRIAKELGMNESSVRSILRKKDFYKSLGTTKSLYKFKSFSRCRSFLLDKMEEQLTAWIRDQNRKRNQLRESDIQRKALELFDELKPEGESAEKFSASRGWFNRFKNRMNLKNCVINDGNLHSDEAMISAFQQEFVRLVEHGNYNLHQIFNAEEMNLYWKRIPSQSFLKKVETNVQGYRPSNDLLTVSLCGNAAGDFKLKPLVVYRSETPFALRDFDKESLPVVWRSNKGALLSREVFEEWYVNYFCPAVETYCCTRGLEFKVLLVLNSTRSHHALPLHENITVVYLPDDATTTSLLQPMTCGFFPMLKTNYLRKVLSQAMSAREIPLVDFWSSYNIKHAIDHIESCWNEVGPEDMMASWHRMLPEVKVKDLDSRLRAIVKEIISMGRSLGLDDLDVDSIHSCPTLWDSDSPVVEFEEMNSKEETLEEEQNVDQELRYIVECIDRACETISKWDQNIERSIKVRQTLQNGIQSYRDLFESKIKEKR